MPARQALKGVDFQTLERMRCTSNQTRIVVALATANRRNKLLILHKEGMLVHSPYLQRECGVCSPSSAPAPHSARPDPRRYVTIVRTEDGVEKAESACVMRCAVNLRSQETEAPRSSIVQSSARICPNRHDATRPRRRQLAG
jgi:hypothetical protein